MTPGWGLAWLEGIWANSWGLLDLGPPPPPPPATYMRLTFESDQIRLFFRTS
jgi:hypothetical protein